jgi:hypothetical protein
MDLIRLRRRCERRLRDLEVPAPFHVHAFCEGLARRRGRPIVLRPLPRASGCSGLWVATPAADVVFYETETSPLHREHIILHELCHLLLGHAPGGAPGGALADYAVQAGLFPGLRPEAVRRTLERAGYSTEEDREAELLASMILERAARSRPRASGRAGPAEEVPVRRLEAALDAAPGAPAGPAEPAESPGGGR